MGTVCQSAPNQENTNLDLTLEKQETGLSQKDMQKHREEAAQFIDNFLNRYPTHDNVGAFYDAQTADDYDNWSKGVNFFAEPVRISELIGKGKELDIDPSTEILDFGAGTGVIGTLLNKKQGFNNIIGIDASTNMVERLKEDGLYKEVKQQYLGRGIENFPEEYKNRFDLVTASGVWLKGHIPNTGYDDVYCAMKHNGYFVTAMRTTYWTEGEKEGYYDKLQQMIREGKFKLVHNEKFMRGYKGDEVGLFGVMESTALIFQKIG